MKKVLLCITLVAVLWLSDSAFAQEWWKTWNAYPKAPKISASELQDLIMAGQKVVIVYAGYKVDQIVCGALYIPYTLVPPVSDGSRLSLRIPKEWWVACY